MVSRLLVLLVLVCIGSQACAGVVYVKWDSPNNGPGGSWDYAYHSITAAVSAAAVGDDIHVAGDSKHPYAETVTAKTGTSLFGGYAGVADQRDSRSYETIIVGKSTSQSTITFGSAANNTVVDSFTIKPPRSGGTCITCASGSPTISGNRLDGDFGYAVSCGGSSTALILRNTIFGGTSASISCYQASPIIRNNVITGNSGYAIMCGSYSAPSEISNTIVANTYGVYVSYATATIVNNIIAYNGTGLYSGGTHGGSLVVYSNCVYGNGTGYQYVSPGTGDINVDPKLERWGFGRIHLEPGSPCIDSGDDSVFVSGDKDIDGQDRHVAGNSDGAAVIDIGADESDGTTWTFDPVAIRVSPTGSDTNDGSA